MKNTSNKIKKKIIAGGLTLCMMTGVISIDLNNRWTTETHAATFAEINQDFVFVKQIHNNTCILSSTAMMLRRAAIMVGDVNWMSITEDTIRPYAWIEGTGIRWDFTCGGFHIARSTDLGGSPEKLISLLNSHPEGIVIHDRTKPHAILVTDYTDGVFYCAEPAAAYPSGRIPMDQAFLTLSNVNDYWYITNTQLSLTPDVVVTPDSGQNNIVSDSNNQNNSQPQEYPVVEDIGTICEGKGDVDGNGIIELVDAQMTLKASLKIMNLNEVQSEVADGDNNGVIELIDAKLVLRAALKME